jgi:hypothetical protein
VAETSVSKEMQEGLEDDSATTESNLPFPKKELLLDLLLATAFPCIA